MRAGEISHSTYNYCWRRVAIVNLTIIDLLIFQWKFLKKLLSFRQRAALQ